MEILVNFVSVNPRGQAQNDQRRVAGPVVQVGRGTQCAIHLPDPRVALTHAEITVSDSGASIRSEPGRVLVNGRAGGAVPLAVGDRVEVGPYLLEVSPPPPGVALALKVTLVNPLEGKKGVLRRALRTNFQLSKRRLSYIAFAGVLTLCLVAPGMSDWAESRFAPPGAATLVALDQDAIRAVSTQFTKVWNPGPVSRSHQIFADDCRACHEVPFVQVLDRSCISCHQGVREHMKKAELTGSQGKAFMETRCAECHRDHKGMQMAPRAQEQCASCHRDIKSVVAKGASEGVTDFRTDHPRFRLSMRDARRPDAILRVRQGGSGSTGMVERSNLKFNHKLHLDPGGIRDLAGTRHMPGTPSGRRTVLNCADCHVPDDSGRLMAPVSMAEHCQRCHSLAFEPQLTSRQVPHGPEKEILTVLSEFYARLALGNAPPVDSEDRDVGRMRPGAAVLTYEDRQRTLRIADEKARLAMRELFQTRQVCTTCHEVKRTTDAVGWQVAPVHMTRVWLPQSRFSHAKHVTQQCGTCHDSAKSADAGHVSIPGIAKCRECHVGAQPVAGKVTSDCASCHSFHAGADYWHAELQNKMLPRRVH